jgi:hypothetical protein
MARNRSYDLQEVEARVTALDNAKRRSYDIYDIEQRVYNLEKNGTGPEPTPETPTIIVKRLSQEATTGEYKATKDTKFMLVSSSNSWSTYGFTVNSVDITSELTSKALQSGSGYAVTYFNMKKDDVLAWTITNNARSFVAFDTNNYGE